MAAVCCRLLNDNPLACDCNAYWLQQLQDKKLSILTHIASQLECQVTEGEEGEPEATNTTRKLAYVHLTDCGQYMQCVIIILYHMGAGCLWVSLVLNICFLVWYVKYTTCGPKICLTCLKYWPKGKSFFFYF